MSKDTHKQLQEITRELQASESRFHNLVFNSPDGILIVDPNGIVRFVNPAAEVLFGRPAAELMDASFGFPVVAGETTELEILHKTGQPAVVDMRVVHTGWEGQPALLASLRDVTRRKQTELQLKQYADDLERSNQELQDFAHVISHDLQAPLRTIFQFCQLLQTNLKGQLDAKSEEYFGYVIDGGRRMSDMINAVLEYSRIGSRDHSLEPTDFTAVFDEAVANLQVEIAEAGATVTHDPLPTIPGDATQLVQLLQNLIGNAIKFRRDDEPPRVCFTAAQQRNEWRFKLSGNGIGIAPGQAERIFKIFHRLHADSEYSGTGIGLAICQKIVERHGGQIRVESQPGPGSVFCFTMPN